MFTWEQQESRGGPFDRFFVSPLCIELTWEKKKKIFFSIIVGYEQSKDNKWLMTLVWILRRKKRTGIWQNGEGPMEKRQLLFGASVLLPFRNWVLCYQSFRFFKKSQKFRLLCELSQVFSGLAQTDAFLWLYKRVWHFFFRRHWHPFYLDWLIWWEQEVHMLVQILKGKEVGGEGEQGRHLLRAKIINIGVLFFTKMYISHQTEFLGCQKHVW